MTEQLVVDDLAFEVRRSPRRKTVELTVDRGGELRINAPPEAGNEWLEQFVREKRFWLYTKLAEKQALQQPVAEKQFVSGEGFPYLGRSYRLKLVERQDQPLKLVAGRFLLRRGEVANGRDTFITWYSDRGKEWLLRRVNGWAGRMGAEVSDLDVRDLGFRWGSCARGQKLFFHWAVILLPPSVVDYIVVHELAHLHESNHSPDFWRLVQRALPDYETRKLRLAELGARATPQHLLG